LELGEFKIGRNQSQGENEGTLRLNLQKRQGLPFAKSQGLAGGDQISLFIGDFNIVISCFRGPAELFRLGGKLTPWGWGREIRNIHIQGHGYGSIGITSRLEGLVYEGENGSSMGHAEDILHIGGKGHRHLRITLFQINQF
jgi:hypothetical protein